MKHEEPTKEHVVSTCPLCGGDGLLYCDSAACGEPARYASAYACGCTVLMCIEHANKDAQWRWDRITRGVWWLNCPTCMRQTCHVETTDIERWVEL